MVVQGAAESTRGIGKDTCLGARSPRGDAMGGVAEYSAYGRGGGYRVGKPINPE